MLTGFRRCVQAPLISRMPSAGHTLRRSQRIRHHRELQEIYSTGSRRHGRFMTVFVQWHTRRITRLGVAAPKRLGNAVTRNRAKRRARAVFCLATLPPGLDVVIAPRRELLEASFATLQDEFTRILA